MNKSQPGAVDLSLQPTRPTPGARRKRPFGLYMILFLLSLQALIGILVALFFGLGLAVAREAVWSVLSPAAYDLAIALGLLIVTAVVVFGLWRFRSWGWYGMMLLLAYYMASDAIAYFGGNPDYISMVLNVAMVFYLNQREVRDLFESPAGEVTA